jgi:hypothetical protein
MSEEIIGALRSEILSTKGLRGYGIYVTTERIAVIKPRRKAMRHAIGDAIGDMSGYGGSGMKLLADSVLLPGHPFSPSKEQTAEIFEDLETERDFQIHRADLEAVSLERRGGGLKRIFTAWGDLTISFS